MAVRSRTVAQLFSLKPSGHRKEPGVNHRSGWVIASCEERCAILEARLTIFLRAKIDKVHLEFDSCFLLPRTPFRVTEHDVPVISYPRLVQEIQRLVEVCSPGPNAELHTVVSLAMRSIQVGAGADSSQAKKDVAYALLNRLETFEKLMDTCTFAEFAAAIAPCAPYTIEDLTAGAMAGFYGEPEMAISERALNQSIFLTNGGYKPELDVFLAQGKPGDVLRHAIVRLERYVYKTIVQTKVALQVAMENIKLAHDTALLISSAVPQDVPCTPGLVLFNKSKNPRLPRAAAPPKSVTETKQFMLHDFTVRAAIKNLVQDATHTRKITLATVVQSISKEAGAHASHQTEAEQELEQRGGCNLTTDNAVDHGDFGRGAALHDATNTHSLQPFGTIDQFVYGILKDKRQSQAALQERLDGSVAKQLRVNLECRIPKVRRNPSVVAFANGTIDQTGRFVSPDDVGVRIPSDVIAVKLLNNTCPRTAHAQLLKYFGPTFLPTRIIDKILTDQRWNEATIRTFFFLMGRLRFPVGHDSLQVMAAMQGLSGCGKTSLLKLIQLFYLTDDIAVFVTMMETTFGLRWMAELFIAIGFDLGPNFTMNASDFLALVSGDVVSFAQKYLNTSQEAPFRAQMIWAFNKFLDLFKKDSHFNMIRRVVYLEMNSIPRRETDLQENFERYECATALVKMLKVYTEDLKNVVRDGSFWTTAASLQISRQFRHNFVTQANPLEDFLRSPYLAMSELVKIKAFCIEKDRRGLTQRQEHFLRLAYEPFSGNEAALSRGEEPQYGYRSFPRDEPAAPFVTEDHIITLDDLLTCFKDYCKSKQTFCTATTTNAFMERFQRYGIKTASSKVAVYFIGIKKGNVVLGSADNEQHTRGSKRFHR